MKHTDTHTKSVCKVYRRKKTSRWGIQASRGIPPPYPKSHKMATHGLCYSFIHSFTLISILCSIFNNWLLSVSAPEHREKKTSPRGRETRQTPKKIRRVISKTTFSTIATHVRKAGPQTRWNMNYCAWWCCIPTQEEFMMGIEENINTVYL